MAGISKRILRPKRNRKRLRGFSRFWRDHHYRASMPEPFDSAYFADNHRYYHKLGLYPWAVNEKPPLAIRKLWVTRLVADFHAWQQELAARYTDYYLAVWLYEPDFGRSQLVAGIEKQKVWYEQIVDEPGDLPFPAEYQTLPGVSDLHWTAQRETTVIWPEDLHSTDAWALKEPHWEAVTAAGEPVIVVQIGWIWVGRAATT
jgi:hypothetical protein